MNQEQIKLVKRGRKVFLNINPALAGYLFYSKLFTDNPQVKKCFQKIRAAIQ